MNLSEIVDKVQQKLGKEESAKIADDLANILVLEESNNKLIQEKENKINSLKNDKDMLIQANGNLLLQVPQAKDTDSFFEGSNKKEESEKQFDFRTIFENGKFKK